MCQFLPHLTLCFAWDVSAPRHFPTRHAAKTSKHVVNFKVRRRSLNLPPDQCCSGLQHLDCLSLDKCRFSPPFSKVTHTTIHIILQVNRVYQVSYTPNCKLKCANDLVLNHQFTRHLKELPMFTKALLVMVIEQSQGIWRRPIIGGQHDIHQN